jgi:outer membrane protein assembly factor BamB
MYRNDPALVRPILVVITGAIVAAHDRVTGMPIWRHALAKPNLIRGRARCYIEQNWVIVVSASDSRSGIFIAATDALVECLDYATGRVVWQQLIPARTDASFVQPVAIIDQGQVLIACTSYLVAFNLATGTLLWNQQIGDPDFPNVAAGLALPGISAHADLS